jgi:hypothetical protein
VETVKSVCWRTVGMGGDLAKLEKKAGGELSILDRAAVVIGHIVGPSILLTTGFLYFIFRICIIVLVLTSLRSMPDSVYDATWAKNIPSVQ